MDVNSALRITTQYYVYLLSSPDEQGYRSLQRDGAFLVWSGILIPVCWQTSYGWMFQPDSHLTTGKPFGMKLPDDSLWTLSDRNELIVDIEYL